MYFEDIKSLKTLDAILAESAEALKDKSRKKAAFDLIKIAGMTGAMSFCSAFAMIAGAVFAPALAIPAAVGLAAGKAAASKNKITAADLREEKELYYMEVIEMQSAMIRELKDEVNSDKERIEYLNGLVSLLATSERELHSDLYS